MRRALVGEAKLHLAADEVEPLLAALRAKAANCPAAAGRPIVPILWALDGPSDERVLGPAVVLEGAEGA